MSDQHQPTDASLPPRPAMPDPDDCCGGGCTPCIFDIYEEQLERWQQRVEEIQARTAPPGPGSPDRG